MSKIETIIIGSFIGIACPLLTFVAFWWPAAWVHINVPNFSLTVVITLALIGLGLGLVLDVFFLRQLVKKFYTASIRLLTIFYLGLCLVAVAFFMGLPVGTFALGIAAGVYTGRRMRVLRFDGNNAAPAIRRTALVTAAVTAMAALPIGILALREEDILKMLGTLLSLSQMTLRGFVGFMLIGVLCFILFVMQYWFSKKAGLLAFYKGNKALD
jgi:hypothetical protein